MNKFLKKALAGVLLSAALTVGFASPAQAATAGSPKPSEIIESAGPAVVRVYEYEEVKRSSYRSATPRYRKVSLGTAFFVSADGYLLTNNHVVDAESSRYTIHDGKKEIDAEVVYRDAAKDVAVLKVSGKDYDYLKLGIDPVKVGDKVIGIGNADGKRFDSVSRGKVTRLGVGIVTEREDVEVRIRGMIQTTARSFHGDSGGPLLDYTGNVAGIVTAIGIGRSARNTSFVVPASIASAVLATAGVTP